MKNSLRNLLLLLFAAAFFLSGAKLAASFLDHRSGTDVYAQAQALAAGTGHPSPQYAPTLPETEPSAAMSIEPQPIVWIPAPIADDPVAEQMQQTDLRALQQENPDVVGWIRIPDTNIN